MKVGKTPVVLRCPCRIDDRERRRFLALACICFNDAQRWQPSYYYCRLVHAFVDL